VLERFPVLDNRIADICDCKALLMLKIICVFTSINLILVRFKTSFLFHIIIKDLVRKLCKKFTLTDAGRLLTQIRSEVNIFYLLEICIQLIKEEIINEI
jgi:hypothetical protein